MSDIALRSGTRGRGANTRGIGHLVDGGYQTFGITTEQDGTVVLEDVGDETASESDSTAMAASAEGAQEAIEDQLDDPGTGVRAPGSAEDVLDLLRWLLRTG